MVIIESQNLFFSIPSIKWSSSRLERFLECNLKDYYTYIHPVRLATNADLTLGKFVHSMIEKFWNDKELPKYKTVDTFKNAMKAKWNFMVSQGTSRGQPLKWRTKQEPWIYRNKMLGLTEIIYKRCSEIGQPKYAEYPFDFVLGGVRFIGSIDELRNPRTVIDHKNYGEYFDPKAPEFQEKLDKKLQLTVYSLAVAVNAYLDHKFASSLEIEVNRKLSWEENLESISSKLDIFMHLVRTGEHIPTQRRTINQYKDLFDLVKKIDEQRARNIFTPNRGNHCYNCNAFEQCTYDTEHGLLPVQKEDGQLSLLESIQIYPEPVSLIKPRNKKEKKKTRQRRLKF